MMTSNSAALAEGDGCCPISADAIVDIKIIAAQSVRFIGAIQGSQEADVDPKTSASCIKARNTIPSPARNTVVSLWSMKPRRDDRALCTLSAAAPVTRAPCFDRA